MEGCKRRILVHGHRGARARHPENTLPAFRYAIAKGVDAIELDVVVTRDGVVVVSHDPVINPLICSGPKPGTPIYALTLAELREYDCGAKKNPEFRDQIPAPGTCIPTLQEVFELARGNSVQFNIETKIFVDRPELTPDPETFTRLIRDMVRKHKLERRVMLQSFDSRTLRVMRQLAPSIPRAALFEEQRDWSEVAREFEATLFGPEYRLVTAERVAQAHDAGMSVVPWTVNKPEEWQKMADDGADAMITDDPAALMDWLEAHDLR